MAGRRPRGVWGYARHLLGDRDDADDDRGVGHGAAGDDLRGVSAQDALGGVDGREGVRAGHGLARAG